MKKIIVFSGTNEGRKLCEFFAESGIEVMAVVATEYGSLVMPEQPFIKVKKGRLSIEEIAELIEGFNFVVDATHPYAKAISENIKKAAHKRGNKILRIIRPSIEYEDVIKCKDLSDACRYLGGTSGNIFATTGIKELFPYTTIENFKERVFLRVLPAAEAVNTCINMGFSASKMICMQGPFSENMNKATMEQIDAKFIVTKESGKSGGLMEKLSAAKQLGVKVIMIGRPCKEEGITLEEAYKIFENELGLVKNINSHFPIFIDLKDKKIIVVGGGEIATRRIEVLISFGASITVVAPCCSKKLLVLYDEKKLGLIKRNYKQEDLKDSYMVIAATNCRKTNEQVFQDAKARGIFINISDKKEQCNFYFPAIFEDNEVIGGLISKEGKKHTVVKEKASMIREYLKIGGKDN